MDNTRITGAAADVARTDLLAVVAAGLFWGTGGLAGAILADRSGIGSLAVAGYRLLIGGGLVVIWLAMTGRLHVLRPGRAGRRRLLVLGLLAGLFQSCYFAAVELTSVSLATLVTLGSAPLLVIAAESLVKRQRPAGRMVAAAGIALVGLTLLVGGPGAADSTGMLAGTAAAVTSAGGFAAMTMLAARPVDGLPALPVTGLAFCLGGAVVLPVAALVGTTAVEIRLDNAGLLLYLGLIPTALAYTLYFSGLRSVPTGAAALTALLEPLTAAVLGAVVLGDRLGAVGIAGGVLVAAAVVVTTVRTPRAP